MTMIWRWVSAPVWAGEDCIAVVPELTDGDGPPADGMRNEVFSEPRHETHERSTVRLGPVLHDLRENGGPGIGDTGMCIEAGYGRADLPTAQVILVTSAFDESVALELAHEPAHRGYIDAYTAGEFRDALRAVVREPPQRDQ